MNKLMGLRSRPNSGVGDHELSYTVFVLKIQQYRQNWIPKSTEAWNNLDVSLCSKMLLIKRKMRLIWDGTQQSIRLSGQCYKFINRKLLWKGKSILQMIKVQGKSHFQNFEYDMNCSFSNNN